MPEPCAPKEVTLRRILSDVLVDDVTITEIKRDLKVESVSVNSIGCSK